MGKKAALHNLGCKVNAYETEAMRQLLEQAGYEIVPFAPGADLYVINTCSVTNIADRKSRQMLHRARKMNPQAIVVAAGCYVQTAQEPVEQDAAIDIILGNNQKQNLLEAIQAFEEKRQNRQEEDDGTIRNGNVVEKIDIARTREYESLHLTTTGEHTRAHIKVQDGCNQFCSYCIIPYARGRVRSRAPEEVLPEARALAGQGCQEIVLTGIHLSSYGIDLGTTLLSLISQVHEVPGIRRIRLGSLEPGIITEPFVRELSALPKVCHHFHLSLQSGCTETLKRMNRRYTAEEFEQKCRLLRETFDRPAITTDVIAGFPGETEEEFAQTEAFLKRLGLYETHIFKYSRRHGTRAALMPDQVDEQIKNSRSERLIALGEENKTKFEQSRLGSQAQVLFEETVEWQGRIWYTGYTKEYIRAAISGGTDYKNVLLEGRLGQEIAPHLFLLER